MPTLIADINPYAIMGLASLVIALLAFLTSLFFNKSSVTRELLEHEANATKQLKEDLKCCEEREAVLLRKEILLLEKIARIDNVKD